MSALGLVSAHNDDLRSSPASDSRVVESPAVQAPVVTPATKRDVLHRAADLLEEFGWCQHAAGEAADGSQLGVNDPDFNRAVAYCRNGAVSQACLDLGVGRQWGFDNGLLGGGTASDVAFNDAPGRTRAEVVARLREAAERSEDE